MSDKIKELVKTAVLAVDGCTGDEAMDNELSRMYIPDCFAEKFAELLILECSSLCYNSNLKDSDAHAMNILNHFNIDGAKHWK